MIRVFSRSFVCFLSIFTVSCASNPPLREQPGEAASSKEIPSPPPLSSFLQTPLNQQIQELGDFAQTRPVKDGMLVKLQNEDLFETGSAILKSSAKDELARLADTLAQFPQNRIRIVGHTDNIGRASFNEELSLRRAEAFRAYLVSRGVKRNQVAVLGAGPKQPIASNQTPSERALNRRLEIKIEAPSQG